LFVLWLAFCVFVYLLLFVYSLFVSTSAVDGPERVIPKHPIMCRVGRSTLLTHSLSSDVTVVCSALPVLLFSQVFFTVVDGKNDYF